MSTLSLFTGPMALLSAATSASEILTAKATESTTMQPTIAAAAAKTTAISHTDAVAPAAQMPAPAHNNHNHNHNHNLSLRSPTAALVYRCHKSATQAWTLVAAVAQPILWLLQHILRILVLVGAALVAATKVVLQRSWQALCWACWWHLWACPPATRLRKKLYFEFALVMMGPSGNGFLLVVLWPGWLVLAAGIWGVSAMVAGV
ncbi:hypothetical protein SBRCBS47491_002907 [Sporothrix bragantina]|uniref:Uncharacterized protein n=1 Tax=Sporothrix bragantina TaxID=671064 RepID=A0ABP0BAV6_9PEZI